MANLGALGRALEAAGFKGRKGQSATLWAPLEGIGKLVAIGLGKTAELTAELTTRKKQYNYYRDRLLTFEKGEVEWKTLGEVALDFGRGKSKHRPRNDPKLYGGNTPFIQTGDIRNASHIIETYSQTYSEIGLKQSKLWSKGTLCITSQLILQKPLF